MNERLPWVRPLVALVISAFFAVPLYFVTVSVFKPGDRITAEPSSPPVPPTLHNISAVLTRPDRLFWVSLTNSVVVTALSVIVLVILSAMLGHYLARTKGWHSRALMLLLLCGLMIPPQVILMPITRVLRFAHLMTTLQGLVLFNVGYYVPFGVFVFSGFIRSIPVELEEAALHDAAGGAVERDQRPRPARDFGERALHHLGVGVVDRHRPPRRRHQRRPPAPDVPGADDGDLARQLGHRNAPCRVAGLAVIQGSTRAKSSSRTAALCTRRATDARAPSGSTRVWPR